MGKMVIMDEVKNVIREQNLLSHLNQEILIVTSSQEKGTACVKEILNRIVDHTTLLLLSGGSTPKKLYTNFAKEESLHPGAVGQIDERFGQPFHESSNQKMIRDTGILRYFQMLGIQFYPILKGVSRQDTALQYDSTLRDLFSIYQKSIGLLGLGADGHTAGISSLNLKSRTKNQELYTTFDYVTAYEDTGGPYKERVTMTFAGLSMLDLLVILVFGDDKKEALKKMFADGSEDEIPARFYKRPEIAKKTILITDQQI